MESGTNDYVFRSCRPIANVTLNGVFSVAHILRCTAGVCLGAISEYRRVRLVAFQMIVHTCASLIRAALHVKLSFASVQKLFIDVDSTVVVVLLLTVVTCAVSGRVTD